MRRWSKRYGELFERPAVDDRGRIALAAGQVPPEKGDGSGNARLQHRWKHCINPRLRGNREAVKVLGVAGRVGVGMQPQYVRPVLGQETIEERFRIAIIVILTQLPAFGII